MKRGERTSSMYPNSISFATPRTAIHSVLSDDGKHRRHSREPEQLLHSGVHPRDAEANPFALTPNKMADQHSQPRRIHIRNLCQVEYVCRRLRTARCRFEDIAKRIRRQRVVHIPAGKWSGQAKHRTVRLAFASFDREPRTLPYLRFTRCHVFPSLPELAAESSTSIPEPFLREKVTGLTTRHRAPIVWINPRL